MKTILIDAYNTFITDNGINIEMQELLDSYKNKKIILTNADKEKQVKLGLIDLPYPMFTLSFNPEKSDPEYYKIFLSENNLNTENVIYFEHNIDAVNSAKSIGIKTYHYDHKKKDLQSLKQFLNENL